MSRPKIYNINEDYFNDPVNPNQLYVLGLIMSDGHLNYKRGMLQYACKKDDVELIEIIKKELKSTHPIKEYKINKKIYVRYNLTNKKLVSSLIDKFDLPKLNKSKNNLKIPTNISTDDIPHLLRGIFDGDGSIWKNKKGDYSFSFTGGLNFLTEIRNIIKHITGKNGFLSYKYSKLNKNSCNITWHGNIVSSKFFNFLYCGEYYLKRKYDRFLIARGKSQESMNTMFKYNGMENKILELYKTKYSQKEISDQLNLKYSSVRCCIQRLRKNKLI